MWPFSGIYFLLLLLFSIWKLSQRAGTNPKQFWIVVCSTDQEALAQWIKLISKIYPRTNITYCPYRLYVFCAYCWISEKKKLKSLCLRVSPCKIYITIPGELFLHRMYQKWSVYLGHKCIIATLKEIDLNHSSWEYLNYLKHWHISTEITHSMYGLCQNQGLNGRKMKILLPCQLWLHNKENNET